MTPDEQERLDRFVRLMAREIDANAHKGDRASRLPVVSRVWFEEIDKHVAKLRAAEEWHRGAIHEDRGHARERCREHAADIANLALFLIDSLGLLEEEPPTATYGSSIYGDDYG